MQKYCQSYKYQIFVANLYFFNLGAFYLMCGSAQQF